MLFSELVERARWPVGDQLLGHHDQAGFIALLIDLDIILAVGGEQILAGSLS